MLIVALPGGSFHGHAEVVGDYPAGDKNKSEDKRYLCTWAGVAVLHVRKDNEGRRAVQRGRC